MNLHGPLVKWPKTPASHAGNGGSNPPRVTRDLMIFTIEALCGVPHNEVGVDGGEGPPVPIPNTEVKLTCADNTWLETAREDK